MSFNSTSTPDLPYYQVLYSGVDYKSLNWAEQRWADWYTYFANPVIATGLLSFLMHEIVYFGRCIPWIIIDAMPYFRKWKLQPNRIPTAQEQWHCTKQVLWAHFTVEGPAIWLFHPMAEMFGMKTYHVPFPSIVEMLPQLLFFFIFEDTYHFLSHQLLHQGAFYKYIHKVHHTYPAPFGLAAEYAHPAEVFILGGGTIIGPMVWCAATGGGLHVLCVYIWITLRLFQAVDAHSGYDFPWSLQHIIPFWAGAEHHDFHHMAFTDNFATSFRWWDWLFGTDKNYRRYRARVERMKLSMKSASKEEVAKEEQRLADLQEQSGIQAEAEVLRTAKTKIF